MWQAYLPGAHIFGIDIDPTCIFQAERIHTAQCDASNSADLRYIARGLMGGEFDIIIDDGSHLEADQVSAFHTLRPFLTRGGVYVIEDVGRVQVVSDQLAFPNEIHRFDPQSQFGDDNLIVLFKDEIDPPSGAGAGGAGAGGAGAGGAGAGGVTQKYEGLLAAEPAKEKEAEG
jgi:hypothetical protein